MEKVVKNETTTKKNLDHYLPQTEEEWLSTGHFKVEDVMVGNNTIRSAFSNGGDSSRLVTMVGGIPRDKERRKKLPLINKLYGHIALKLLKVKESSVMYNQPATGKSDGSWEEETLATRARVVTEITDYFANKIHTKDIALIGTSAGAYMTVRSLRMLKEKGYTPSRVTLISPAFYPDHVENVPYGEKFKEIISSSWDLELSPLFSDLRAYVLEGGSVLISFFENDDPPIPLRMQEFCKKFANELSEKGGKIEVITIPGVAHNFRKIGVEETKNVIDNKSVRDTASTIFSFLSKE